MYKKLSSIILLLALFAAAVVSARPALAVDVLSGPCSGAASSSSVCKDKNALGSTDPIIGPNGIITEVVKILSLIVGVAAVIMVIIGGFRLVIAGGNPNDVGSARSSIIFALVGLLLAASAQLIVAFVLDRV